MGSTWLLVIYMLAFGSTFVASLTVNVAFETETVTIPALEPLTLQFEAVGDLQPPKSSRVLLFRYRSGLPASLFRSCVGLGWDNSTVVVDSESPYDIADGFTIDSVGQTFHYVAGVEETVEVEVPGEPGTNGTSNSTDTITVLEKVISPVLCEAGYKVSIYVTRQNDPGETTFFLITALGVGGAMGVFVVIAYAATKRRDMLDGEEGHMGNNNFNLFSITEKTGETDASYERNTHSLIHDRMAMKSKRSHKSRSFNQPRGSKPHLPVSAVGSPDITPNGSGIFNSKPRSASSGSGWKNDIRSVESSESISNKNDVVDDLESGASFSIGEDSPVTEPPGNEQTNGQEGGSTLPSESGVVANGINGLARGRRGNRRRKGRRRGGNTKRPDARAIREQGKRTAELHKSNSPVMQALEDFVQEHHPMLSKESVHLHCRQIIIACGGHVRKVVAKLQKEYGEAPDLLLNQAVDEFL